MTAPDVEAFPALYEDVSAAVSRLREVDGDVPPSVSQLIDEVADRFSTQAPEIALSGVDPYLGQALLAAILYSEKCLRHDRVDCRRRTVRVGLERMRQALRDILDEAPSTESQSAKAVARWLAQNVSVPQAQLADLLDVSPRTWQRWVSETEPAEPEADAEARVRAVARIVAHLRYAFTAPGVIRWFERPHPMLHDKPPKSLLDDPAELPVLTRLAAQTRSMVAS